ncbi:hypothetical protein LSH36_777g00004 [Paralvinella palmiformis]|uniref:Uncharacterized protein n=1 Tax=Paralvinella palmiformis TaxID=53620 RepID=A0AAD9J1B8_9ANNE|nr:hypothetical protein LSH36_777g00004 [Paralvinella palmiformis]
MDTKWHLPLLGIGLHLLFVIVADVSADRVAQRRPEILFANSTLLNDRKVTCDNFRPSDGKFAADTWACHNMKVDGLYLRYWYIPGFGADTGCSDGKSKYDSRNDLAELCRQMMRAHGVHKELWAAYVNKASCLRSPGKRVIFALSGDTFHWETVPQGNGYVITFRCMAVD